MNNFEDVIEQVLLELKVKISINKEISEIRLCKIKFNKYDELLNRDIYTLYMRSLQGMHVNSDIGVQDLSPIKVNSEEELEFVEVATLQVTDGRVDIICNNALQGSRAEIQNVIQTIHYIKNNLYKLGYRVLVTEFTNYEDEFYKDKEGQWHSTEYGYFIKDIVEDARAKLLAQITHYIADIIGTPTFADAHALESKIDAYITEVINADINFENKFKSFIHEAFSLKTDIKKISNSILSDISIVPTMELRPLIETKDFDSIEFKDAIKVITKDFFYKFFEQVNAIFAKRLSSKNIYNVFLKIAGIDTEEAKAVQEEEDANSILGKFPELNQEVDEYISKEEEESRDKASEEDQKGNTIADALNTQSDDYIEDLIKVQDYINDQYEYDAKKKTFISFNDGKQYRVNDVFDAANKALDTNVPNYIIQQKYNIEEPEVPQHESNEGSNIYTDAIASENKYQSFRNKAKNIYAKLEELYEDVNQIIDIEATGDDAGIKKQYLALLKKLAEYKNLPQDIYNSLKNSLIAVDDIKANIQYFQSVLLFNIQLTTVFMENFDYKKAVSNIRSILNANSRLLSYFEFKHNTVKDLEKTKDIKPTNVILDRSTGLYKTRINELLKSTDSSDLGSAVKNLENLLTQLQTYISTL